MRILCSLGIILCFTVMIGLAQTAPDAAPADSAPAEEADSTINLETILDPDLAALRESAAQFETAFNAGKAAEIAAMFAEKSEYLDDAGNSLSGRDEIEKGYTAFFAENPHAKLDIVIDSLRLLGDSAAIEEGHSILEPAAPGQPGVSHYTAVHLKKDGQWQIASVRETLLETPSSYGNIADLEFLIGTWHAEEHGTKMESVCSWIANKSFVQRRYTLTHTDGTKTSGLQIIGWNPQIGQVQSWNFGPDGGHAVGTWVPTEEGWSSKMQGTTGDGTVTASINFLVRLDDNAYVWQSVERSLGDVALPDTDEVVLKRVTDAD